MVMVGMIYCVVSGSWKPDPHTRKSPHDFSPSQPKTQATQPPIYTTQAAKVHASNLIIIFTRPIHLQCVDPASLVGLSWDKFNVLNHSNHFLINAHNHIASKEFCPSYTVVVPLSRLDTSRNIASNSCCSQGNFEYAVLYELHLTQQEIVTPHAQKCSCETLLSIFNSCTFIDSTLIEN